MAAKKQLREYESKRRFDRTPEPRGDAATARSGETADETGDAPCFVVQIHDASTLHFDFRLEVEGVLASWSVPKGPSTDPGDKRLAMPTEDHPLEYREFEGVIEEGEYGAGTVIVWDEGTYRPLTRDRRKRPVPFAEALRDGHVSFRLDGGKLHGSYALTRFRGGGDQGGRESWLLVKEKEKDSRGKDQAKTDAKDSRGGTPDPTRAKSARTGRTLRQVAAEEGAKARSAGA
ncbi:3'-phosphoesterase [Streptomyces armeniacus]|uniref:3'-phosphoesterase n=1 Tax=Streptomyces armeniacus TaxID=83291 RepID=A0A345Y0G1_9ACTN|nr:DNA polymerase ligase N-terminal domain-containing protein [Streptomyces armeniacus]AXK37377.1 3'-phosphoesterase [Streptomyces armeniacus]